MGKIFQIDRARHHHGIGHGHYRLVQPWAGAGSDGAAVQRGARGAADEPFAEHRLIHESEHRVTLEGETDENAKQWHTGDKGAGAVDRIDDPLPRRLGTRAAMFLTENAMLGKMGLDAFVDGGFGLPVCDGDRLYACYRGVFLVHCKGLAKMAQHDGPCCVSQRVCKG